MLSRPDFTADPGPPDTRAISVSELNRSARTLLERGFPLLGVRGEISNFTRAASGHLYFSLKDGTAQVRCAMWKNRAALLAWQPRDGDAVEVRATVTLFEARGEFQLNVEAVTRAGAGALFEAFLRLKEKLAREGMFDPARKRDLPRLPRAIGLVTSLQAAALRDVLTTLRRRAPMVGVIVYPVPVQGEGAAARIAAALETANTRAEVDVIIVCRGGGSIEDLWAFNEEAVARAIAASRLPVVSGVGHETDFTIADFAADVRAPTPTAAAELVAPARDALLAELSKAARALLRATENRLGEARQRLDWSTRGLIAPSERLAMRAGELEASAVRLTSAAARCLESARTRLAIGRTGLRSPDLARFTERMAVAGTRIARGGRHALGRRRDALARAETALAHLDPMRVLARGYAVVRNRDGRTVLDATGLSVGEALDITLARGVVGVRVEKAD